MRAASDDACASGGADASASATTASVADAITSGYGCADDGCDDGGSGVGASATVGVIIVVAAAAIASDVERRTASGGDAVAAAKNWDWLRTVVVVVARYVQGENYCDSAENGGRGCDGGGCDALLIAKIAIIARSAIRICSFRSSSPCRIHRLRHRRHHHGTRVVHHHLHHLRRHRRRLRSRILRACGELAVAAAVVICLVSEMKQ